MYISLFLKRSLAEDAHIAFWGRRSRELLECGSGSTAVVTELRGNPLEESRKRCPRAIMNFEEWEGAEIMVYTVTAPAGKNVDRDCMDIEPEDRGGCRESCGRQRREGFAPWCS